ncbi:hypothetical protein JZO70_16300 [Enterococcus sp. 669A]|uniref:Glycosyl hydrolase n=2 Tax=Candidatus Enterococcus moelleringii TaxID=2815325 RepID=A0ABS3LDM6_9ENTE|nr:hypothetical protein [Enterococcus sp. 669A]
MNPELFIIELLSSKEKILAYDKETRQKNLLAIIGYLIGTSGLFFGLATLVYRAFPWRLWSITSNYILEGLYYFSLAVGIICLVVLLGLLVKNVFGGLLMHHSYNRWLEKNAGKTLKVQQVYQENGYYYLADKSKVPKIRLAQTDCLALTTTMDGATIIIGRKPQFPGIGSNQLFILNGEPAALPQTFSKAHSFNQRAVLLLAGLLFVAMAGISYYEVTSYYQTFYGTDAVETTYSFSSQEVLDAGGLLTQQGPTPDYQISQTNQLELVTDSDELYMTTDNGTNWSFIPLKPEWLRFGSYLLTSGEIPMGYWMDKTYDISPDFSWFIYSQNAEAVEFLSSKDNGQTWQKSLVTENDGPWIRYRKASFFPNGSGVLVYSTASPEVSSEGLEIYFTSDFGQTWNRSNGTTISQPVQNVSFVNPTLGFVSTREQLYYTNNSGSSFKEAVVTIPEGYQTGGLDLFQSPNEVIQVSTNLLETRFYLLKMEGIDQGKMFACRYQSSDNGETWQLAEQLSQVELTD